MGQLLVFAEDVENLPEPPQGLPTCPGECPANAAPWVRVRRCLLACPAAAAAHAAVMPAGPGCPLLCSATPCLSSLQTKSTVQEKFGDGGFEIPNRR